MCIGEIRRIRRRSLLLDLQEERIVRAVALEIDAVIAQAYGAGANHFEGYVDGMIKREQVLTLQLEHFAIGAERIEDLFRFHAGNARQVGLDFLEATHSWFARHRLGELIEGMKGRGTFRLEQRLMNRFNVAETMHLKPAYFKQRHF